MTPSKKFQEVEQAKVDLAQKEQDETRHAEWTEARVIFLAPASKYRVANWEKEVKNNNGDIVSPEDSLRFEDNLFITDDPEKIAFIRKSYGFVNGHIRECKDMAEAINFRTKNFVDVKGQRQVETAVEESQRL